MSYDDRGLLMNFKCNVTTLDGFRYTAFVVGQCVGIGYVHVAQGHFAFAFFLYPPDIIVIFLLLSLDILTLLRHLIITRLQE
jgi:hypothetical protein